MDDMDNAIGKRVQQSTGYEAFIPEDACGIDFHLSGETVKKANDATLKVGKLDGITKLLSDIEFYPSMYIRKNAAHSSNIEGTQATLIHSIKQEAGASSDLPDDVSDIAQYVKAMDRGFKELEQIPLSSRFIRLLHKEPIEGGKQSHHSDPGNSRTSQNWIGGANPVRANFVPPPPSEVVAAMGSLEKFIHKEDNILPIIKAGIVHAHFETIHPFLDGNGRTGRLLITFFLNKTDLLERPILFLSSFFMQHRSRYYDGLQAYHNGDYQKWINFFIDGVIEIADESIDTINRVVEIRERDMKKIAGLSKRASETTLKIYPGLFSLPIVNASRIMELGGLSRPGARTVLNRLIEMEILQPLNPDKKYGRFYVYRDYLRVFTK